MSFGFLLRVPWEEKEKERLERKLGGRKEVIKEERKGGKREEGEEVHLSPVKSDRS